MTRARSTRTGSRRKRRQPRQRFRLAFPWPGVRRRRRRLRALWALPRRLQLVTAAIIALGLWAVANWVYQVVRKPAELFFPVSEALSKLPSETWRQYRPIFEAHSTTVITPEFLAALAQIEGAGNPVARTYWRWRFSLNPFEWYRPASSAVGMYQITDATFAEARRYCIHDHVVVEDGPWHALHSCWFNSLYTRVVPSHAAELTSAYLDRYVADTLGRHRIGGATLQQKQDLAAVIHLCGAGVGNVYARRGFHPADGQRCGDHELRAYLARLHAMKREFARLAGSTGNE